MQASHGLDVDDLVKQKNNNIIRRSATNLARDDNEGNDNGDATMLLTQNLSQGLQIYHLLFCFICLSRRK